MSKPLPKNVAKALAARKAKRQQFQFKVGDYAEARDDLEAMVCYDTNKYMAGEYRPSRYRGQFGKVTALNIADNEVQVSIKSGGHLWFRLEELLPLEDDIIIEDDDSDDDDLIIVDEE